MQEALQDLERAKHCHSLSLIQLEQRVCTGLSMPDAEGGYRTRPKQA